MNTCDGCKFFSDTDRFERPFGFCSSENWKEGYQFDTKELELNQIIVENDEGWAFKVGPKFGCIHWQAK